MAFEYLDRFEDGDASDWTNLVASNLSNLSGNWLGELSATNEALTATSPTFTEFQNNFYTELKFTAQTSTSPDESILQARDASGDLVFRIRHDDGSGDLTLNGTTVGSWAANTTYEYRFNIDYDADTIDLIRNGTTIATGVATFTTGVSGIDTLELTNNTSGSGDTRSVYIDDVAYIRLPNTPQNFAAVQGASVGEIDTSWDDVAQETSYNLYRAESSGVTTGDTLVTEPAQDVVTYTDTGREDGEQFFYAVTAEDEEGESALSNEDSAITILPQTNFDTVMNT